ncbi:tachykinin-3b [Genypterus blacodes]|uniref:tachykinin-3b n=1 Tax=Genypterus blacodes TaxID=154954 RepID=UPI003F77236A
MERIINCCSLAVLAVFLTLFSSPGSGCKEFPYRSPTDDNPGGCGSDAAALKRFGDIDYDSFVSLMGRRSADKPDDLGNDPVLRKGDIIHVLSGLLGQKNSQSKEASQARRGLFLPQGRLRFQRFE